MAVRQGKVTIAAGAESPNVLLGSEFEFLSRPARCTLSAVSSNEATKATWIAGSVFLIEVAQFTFAGTPGFPVIPDNVLDVENIPQGQRQQLTFRNDHNASVDVYWRFDVDYL